MPNFINLGKYLGSFENLSPVFSAHYDVDVGLLLTIIVAFDWQILWLAVILTR